MPHRILLKMDLHMPDGSVRKVIYPFDGNEHITELRRRIRVKFLHGRDDTFISFWDGEYEYMSEIQGGDIMTDCLTVKIRYKNTPRNEASSPSLPSYNEALDQQSQSSQQGSQQGQRQGSRWRFGGSV